MEFGLHIANMELGRLRDVAQAAEGLGYGLITFPDHIVLEGPAGQYDPHALCHDPMIAAAVTCEATKKIRIGHQVLCNLFRHPAITAQSLASLDHLSAGRLIAGLGAGWTEREFRMTGINYPDVTTRLAMLDEALTCMRALWTNERTSLAGRFYKFENAILWPKPLQKPHPPILVGGSGRGLLRVAAKHADVVNIILDAGKAGQLTFANIAKLTDDAYKEKVRFLRDEARRQGREPDTITMSNSIFTIVLADSHTAAEAMAQNMASAFGTDAASVLKSPLSLIGTPEECVLELKRRAREWEVRQFIFAAGGEKTMRRLAEEVLAHV
jgi:probable F420-dependent oxidoreductase